MRLRRNWRGPRIGTKLFLLGLTLLIVPWFSYRQLVVMESLLVQGQSRAQLLTAEGISTLFNGREDLFNDLPVTIEDYESLFARPLEANIRLDGSFEDWGEDAAENMLAFGSDAGADGAFSLLLGERGGQLYVFMQVTDPEIVYRNPAYLRLDNADHVRLSFIRVDGEDGRISLVFPEPGPVTAYAMDNEWRFAAAGAPDGNLRGFASVNDGGWNLEFRLPLTMLGSTRYFGVTVADVDEPGEEATAHLVQTLPKAGKESFDLVVLRSPEVLNIIQGLGYAGARILVIDAEQRVRAQVGGYNPTPAGDAGNPFTRLTSRLFEWLRPVLDAVVASDQAGGAADSESGADQIIADSLSGRTSAMRRQLAEDLEIIMAAHPIVSEDAVIGTVVVEQNIDDILTFQRVALEQVTLLSIASLVCVLVALLGFAARLAWRIRHLRQETSAAIDQYGRLRAAALKSETRAGDEIGDLARSISQMLSKLHQHNHFLETMPRTLRHEINNPLNTLSTSLQNMFKDHEGIKDSKYFVSARNGVNRIGAIVHKLSDAANLEESLKSDELERIDVHELLKSYVANCALVHQDCEFIYRGVGQPVHAHVADYRIEQLLDKIIDNAVDFHRIDSPITVQLDVHQASLRITVANRGPLLPGDSEKSLFDSMVTHREPESQVHFGLGLYVVRVIAEHHGGHVRAMNLADGSGIAVVVQLPLARPRLAAATGQAPASRPEDQDTESASRYAAAS